MASHSPAFSQAAPARQTFYVIKQDGSPQEPGIVTVLHRVPAGAEQLAWFHSPGHALDFAEEVVRQLKETGAAVEMVDPPFGLVGAG